MENELEEIVGRMVQAGESEENIKLVIQAYESENATAEPTVEETTVEETVVEEPKKKRSYGFTIPFNGGWFCFGWFRH